MCHIFLNPPPTQPMSGEVFQSKPEKEEPSEFSGTWPGFFYTLCLFIFTVCVCVCACVRFCVYVLISVELSRTSSPGKEGAGKSSETFLGRICMRRFARACLFVCSRPRRIKRGRRRESVCSAVHIYDLSSSPPSLFLSSSSLYHSSPVSFPIPTLRSSLG